MTRIAILSALFCLSTFAADYAQPDPQLTPGAVDPHVTQTSIRQTICRSGYTASVRNVSEATKKEVMTRYGRPVSDLHSVEIDHFVSLEIGGLNDITNLWPQPMPEARKKDVVETWLKRQVCSGAMKLADAQKAIYRWPELYRQIEGQ
jgi:hypothetical protein